ncbi:MAG: IPT/TIG domain-containing protein, partial [Actinomycetota bacterium]|nr:IPT/TIG domain-containing protein [Actinomycetota bacterium]
GEIIAVSPAGTGGVHVTVTSAGGTSNKSPADEFTYFALPTVTKVEPASGPTAGGTSVTITGTNLSGAMKVKFGSTESAGFKVEPGGQIVALSPAGSGIVHVTVTTPGGTSGEASVDAFTYTTTPGGGGPPPPNGGKPPPPPPPGPPGLPAPLLARTANLAAIAGRVFVRLPGTRGFAALTSPRQVPYGTLVEATHGEVRVTAAGAHGVIQRGWFLDGKFVLTQARTGIVFASLRGGKFSSCRVRAGRPSKPASPTHLVRRLWAYTSGNFSMKGKFATGIGQGAQWWLVEDMCQGTLMFATHQPVQVTDLVRHKHLAVVGGHVYLAKAR